MKRAWVGLVLAGLIADGAQAGELRLGAWLGPNVASLDIEGVPEAERESRTDLAAGGVLGWRWNSGWSLQLRPSYAGRGARVQIEGAQADISAGYFELPLLVTRELGSGRARPYLLAGAAFAQRTSAKAKFGATEIDIDDDFESSDASLRFGAGLRGNRDGAEPFVEVEYTHGLKDLNTAGAGLGSEVGAIRNRGFQIRAGVSFGLGEK